MTITAIRSVFEYHDTVNKMTNTSQCRVSDMENGRPVSDLISTAKTCKYNEYVELY